MAALSPQPLPTTACSHSISTAHWDVTPLQGEVFSTQHGSSWKRWEGAWQGCSEVSGNSDGTLVGPRCRWAVVTLISLGLGAFAATAWLRLQSGQCSCIWKAPCSLMKWGGYTSWPKRLQAS